MKYNIFSYIFNKCKFKKYENRVYVAFFDFKYDPISMAECVGDLASHVHTPTPQFGSPLSTPAYVHNPNPAFGNKYSTVPSPVRFGPNCSSISTKKTSQSKPSSGALSHWPHGQNHKICQKTQSAGAI
jgi:hypothetical protein